MTHPNIKSYNQIIPMVYGYTTPGIPYHDGWTKIGYTDKQTVEARIRQQTHTANIKWELAWKDNAIYRDGSGETFTDHDFHRFLQNTKYVEREKDTEWFKIDGETSERYLYEFAKRASSSNSEHIEYTLRKEQAEAVKKTADYFKYHNGKKFLWNAKPRFGKTLTTYDLVRTLKYQNVLIVTNRPAIANSWVEDFNKFIGWRDEYLFVSETDSLRGKAGVLTHDQYLKKQPKYGEEGTRKGMIAFESLQSLKGSICFGGPYKKLEWINNIEFDLLIIDESQEGIETFKTEYAFKRLKANKRLYLSGTPFKQLASDEFNEDQIYNWSYADEQEAKESWESESKNPYGKLPKLNMFTYELSNMIYDKLQEGARITDEYTTDYAFDLNEFFQTKENGRFVHEEEVLKFIKSLYTQERYPFSTQELRDELKHTLWYFNRVDSCKAMAKLLKKDEVFKDYEIVLAAGDGRLEENDELVKAFDKVKKAIQKNDKTITLTVGQLTVGVTIPEWSAVLMLCNLKSPSSYMQAAFRAQNTSMLNINGQLYQKENAYIFDFDPSRTLIIFDEFANNLSTRTNSGKGTSEEREENIRRLLNFFPVLGEDSEGRMVELDPKQVLTIPCKLKSQEVVRSGFMSNYLFANISNIFSAPKAVTNIIEQMGIAHEDKGKKKNVPVEVPEDLPLDENGEVDIPKEIVIGKTQDLFGDKVYDEPIQEIEDTISTFIPDEPKDDTTEKVKELEQKLKDISKKNFIDKLNEEYQPKPSVVKAIEAETSKKIENNLKEVKKNFETQKNITQANYEDALENASSPEEVEEVKTKYEEEIQDVFDTFTKDMQSVATDTLKESAETATQRFEEAKVEEEKKSIETTVRDHLRGFSRAIPSFIMAYGDDKLTLTNLDDYTEDDVFLEVTGIEESNFRFLRDGGYYVEDEEGSIIYLNIDEVSKYPDAVFFEGQLFDQEVFNASIKEFLHKKDELRNYFDESLKEDIFDYIPPQKTNQIYTPKKIVKQMVDLLEEENPGCYDDPSKTFIDLYMKSGLYITEIVKKLYNSPKIKEVYPDDKERLQHIFEKQVFGLAPTRIIYLIARNFILGFDKDFQVDTNNIRECDTLPYAKDGTLSKKLDELFGGDE